MPGLSLSAAGLSPRARRLTPPAGARSLNANFFSISENARRSDEYFHPAKPGCDTATKARGRALVFIHGWTLDLEVWNPQAAAFAAVAARRPLRPARLRPLGRRARPSPRTSRISRTCSIVSSSSRRRSSACRRARASRSRSRCASPIASPASCSTARRTKSAMPAAAGDEDFSIAEYRALVARPRRRCIPRVLARAPADAAALGAIRRPQSSSARMLARYPARDLRGRRPPCRRRRQAASRSRASRSPCWSSTANSIRRSGAARAKRSRARCRSPERVVHRRAPATCRTSTMPHAYNGALQAFLRRQSRAAA